MTIPVQVDIGDFKIEITFYPGTTFLEQWLWERSNRVDFITVRKGQKSVVIPWEKLNHFLEEEF